MSIVVVIVVVVDSSSLLIRMPYRTVIFSIFSAIWSKNRITKFTIDFHTWNTVRVRDWVVVGQFASNTWMNSTRVAAAAVIGSHGCLVPTYKPTTTYHLSPHLYPLLPHLTIHRPIQVFKRVRISAEILITMVLEIPLMNLNAGRGPQLELLYARRRRWR